MKVPVCDVRRSTSFDLRGAVCHGCHVISGFHGSRASRKGLNGTLVARRRKSIALMPAEHTRRYRLTRSVEGPFTPLSSPGSSLYRGRIVLRERGVITTGSPMRL
jgi:hypothetical protein